MVLPQSYSVAFLPSSSGQFLLLFRLGEVKWGQHGGGNISFFFEGCRIPSSSVWAQGKCKRGKMRLASYRSLGHSFLFSGSAVPSYAKEEEAWGKKMEIPFCCLSTLLPHFSLVFVWETDGRQSVSRRFEREKILAEWRRNPNTSVNQQKKKSESIISFFSFSRSGK